MDKTEKYLKSIDAHISKIERHLKKLVEQNDAALQSMMRGGTNENVQ